MLNRIIKAKAKVKSKILLVIFVITKPGLPAAAKRTKRITHNIIRRFFTKHRLKIKNYFSGDKNEIQ